MAGGRRDRSPLWFHAPDGALLLLAGLAFERDGERRFVVVTTAANERMRPLHDRMPALLSRDAAVAWLERADPLLLRPAPDAWLAAREVSTRVNDPRQQGPALLEAAPRRQLTLL